MEAAGQKDMASVEKICGKPNSPACLCNKNPRENCYLKTNRKKGLLEKEPLRCGAGGGGESCGSVFPIPFVFRSVAEQGKRCGGCWNIKIRDLADDLGLRGKTNLHPEDIPTRSYTRAADIVPLVLVCTLLTIYPTVWPFGARTRRPRIIGIARFLGA